MILAIITMESVSALICRMARESMSLSVKTRILSFANTKHGASHGERGLDLVYSFKEMGMKKLKHVWRWLFVRFEIGLSRGRMHHELSKSSR